MKSAWISAVALTLFSTAAFAQDAAGYPARPIRMIVPFAPGGGLDITTRLIGQKLTAKWGQNIVVDTRPGAATIVGTEIASKAAPDGYTLLMITTTFAINPGLRARLPYDPLKDFAPVTQLNAQPNVIVVAPGFAGKSIKDLIALAQAKPGELTFASPGAGSAPHLAAEMFQRAAGIRMIHVPYKGIPPAVTDVPRRPRHHAVHHDDIRRAARQFRQAACPRHHQRQTARQHGGCAHHRRNSARATVPRPSRAWSRQRAYRPPSSTSCPPKSSASSSHRRSCRVSSATAPKSWAAHPGSSRHS